MDDLPAHLDPDQMYNGNNEYDVEAGYTAPPGINAPAKNSTMMAYKPTNNRRNDAWDGEEKDTQFRAMDLLDKNARSLPPLLFPLLLSSVVSSRSDVCLIVGHEGTGARRG